MSVKSYRGFWWLHTTINYVGLHYGFGMRNTYWDSPCHRFLTCIVHCVLDDHIPSSLASVKMIASILTCQSYQSIDSRKWGVHDEVKMLSTQAPEADWAGQSCLGHLYQDTLQNALHTLTIRRLCKCWLLSNCYGVILLYLAWNRIINAETE